MDDIVKKKKKWDRFIWERNCLKLEYCILIVKGKWELGVTLL